MENVIAMMKLFGERYVYCTNEQALYDAEENRESLQDAFSAILEYVELKKGGE